VPCFTPVRSPESNGIAEAFVKTFKRDHVLVRPRPDTATMVAQLDSSFEDYNETHPHRASGCAHLASSSGRINPPPVRSNGGNSTVNG
jgi:hypothetical protein